MSPPSGRGQRPLGFGARFRCGLAERRVQDPDAIASVWGAYLTRGVLFEIDRVRPGVDLSLKKSARPAWGYEFTSVFWHTPLLPSIRSFRIGPPLCMAAYSEVLFVHQTWRTLRSSLLSRHPLQRIARFSWSQDH